MKRWTEILLAGVLLFDGSASVFAAAPEGFVAKDGNRLMRNGREYRAIGVNMPNLHQSYFGTWLHNKDKYGSDENAKQAMIAGVEDASRSGFKFIRFFADPGYPKDIDLLYARNPEKYWKLMDEVFALCRANDLRLVPCLNMIDGCFAEYYGEPKQAILDPESKTHQAAYKYIRDFVTRYKDDPLVLMWELGNERMLNADVDMQGRKALPAECFTDDKQPREFRTREDSLTFHHYLRLYKEQATLIKKLDPNHLVNSGDAAVRQECTSRRETFPNFKFRDDTSRERIANNLYSQPEPLDVYSYHFYPHGNPRPRWGMTEGMRKLLVATLATDTPVYIGELGQDRPSFGEDPEAKATIAFIDMADEVGVSLISLWVWHFTWQPDRTLSSATHPALVERCAAWNRKYAGEGK